MSNTLKHLQAVADILIKAGYMVEEPRDKFPDLLDVWGYVTPKGRTRRVKCFHEIYCAIHEVDGWIYSYWHVDYDSQDEHIELAQRVGDKYVQNTADLIHAVSKIIEPLKRRKAA